MVTDTAKPHPAGPIADGRADAGQGSPESYRDPVIEIGSRVRSQPPPPHVVFEALVEPDRDPARPWLTLLDDEVAPAIAGGEEPTVVTWSSIWIKRPDAIIRFDLAGNGPGTDLRWTLYVDDPVPDASLVGHMRKRINQLINANLRYTFGQ